VLAFVVGMLPDTLLVRLQELARSFAKSMRKTLSLVERYPLTDLEGIDIYDRARLLDEGVSNIEGLAHHDLPSLMMYTRIPAGRLVHWTDQAILFLHVAATSDEGTAAEERLARLKAYGIHTATDLESARDAAESRGQRELEAFLALLDDEPAAGRPPPSRIQVILDAVADEQWMRNLRWWHRGDYDDVPKTLLLEEPFEDLSSPAPRSDGKRTRARTRTAG
jgi:hypothetical protein